MALRAVTLDAAGTLIALAEPVATVYTRIAAEHGIALAPAAVEAAFRAAFAAAPPLAFPGASPTQLDRHEQAWWYAIVRRAFGPAAQHPRFDACFAALYAHYARPDAWRVVPGAHAALAALADRGLGLAVVSNFDARLGALLPALGLVPPLATIVCSGRAGFAKPDPAIFVEALRRLGARPAEAVHVGDDLAVDVAGAQAAGMSAILVDPKRPTPPPRVRRVRSVADVPALLTLF